MNTKIDMMTTASSEEQRLTLLSRDMSIVVELFKTLRRSSYWLSQEEDIGIDLDLIDLIEERLIDAGDRLESLLLYESSRP